MLLGDLKSFVFNGLKPQKAAEKRGAVRKTSAIMDG